MILWAFLGLMRKMISVAVVGVQPIVNGLNNAPKTVERVSENRLRKLGPIVVGNVRRETPEDTGKLKNAIDDEVSIGRDKTVTLTVAADSSVKPVVVASVAGGTKPHWPPWGPGSELAAWAKRKGIPVFLVARAISRRGTIKRFGGPSKGAEMFVKGLLASRSDIDNMARDIEQDIAKGLF
jgi:hypothetical protein